MNSKRNQILLLKKNQKQKIGAGEWLLPGGTVEFGEDIEISLIREINEETNLKIKNLQILNLKKMIINNDHWLGIYYLAEVSDENQLINIEQNKHAEVKFVNIREVPDFRDYSTLQFITDNNSNNEIFISDSPGPENHTLGTYFYNYLYKKVHNLIRVNHDLFSRIRVIGSYNRTSHVSIDEKNDKLFNYKRPTVFLDGDILYVSCFPGEDYIYHYANLIASYLKIIDQKKLVSYFLPNEKTTERTLMETNIQSIPDCEVLIFGNVDKIEVFIDKEFEGNGDFMWKSGDIGGKKILLLGCKFSIWGNTGYHLVKALDKVSKFTKFIYVGKLGTLNIDTNPNEWLATGSKSYLNNTYIEWENIFEKSIKKYKNIIDSKHITVASVIDETKEKMEKLCKYGELIDPEIGNMALACNELGKKFFTCTSYLTMYYLNKLRTFQMND